MKFHVGLLLLPLLFISLDKESATNPSAREEQRGIFQPKKVLFIGNSHTLYNGGLDSYVRGFLENASLDYRTLVEKVAFGGYSLEDHLASTSTLLKLGEKDWDVVVLQENTSVLLTDKSRSKAAFPELSSKLPDEKTKLYMFMTWAYEDNPSDIDSIQETLEQIRPLVSGTIVPVGLAFKNLVRNPENAIDLYIEDGVHSTPEGSFLAAAMFYASIYGLDPTENDYTAGLEESDANYLKVKAKEAIETYNN